MKKFISLIMFLFSFSILIYSLFFIEKSNYKISYYYNLKSVNFIELFPKINKFDKNIKINYFDEIFNSKQLFINDNYITNKYIHFIRNIKEKKDNDIYEEDENKDNYKDKFLEGQIEKDYIRNISINESINFGEFCVQEKLVESKIIKNYKVLISIIIPCFNKADVIMKSVRSIQNQSFKNLEIIIVDDYSTDNSSLYYKYLLKTEPRIRIFNHLKNMGVWRTRLDGFLYSRGKYIIHFDAGDLYADQFVLEDSYKIIERYKLDSLKMIFKCIYNYSYIEHSYNPFDINLKYNKIVYKSNNIKKYNYEIFSTWGNIWTRLTKASIINKALFLLDSKILNIYKNLWEDCWWNRLIDEVSYSFSVINRISYLYYRDGKGEGDIKIETKEQKNKIIHEFLNFLYFDLKLLPKNNNKNEIIKNLHEYTKNRNININFMNSNFNNLNFLLILLIKDPFVSNIKKVFLKRLLKESLKKKKVE